MPDLICNQLFQDNSNDEQFTGFLTENKTETDEITYTPHPKFIRGLRYLFAPGARDMQYRDVHDDPESYKNCVMTLHSYRLMYARFTPYTGDSAPIQSLTWAQYHLFLEFQDTYWNMDPYYVDRIGELYTDSPQLLQRSTLDFYACLSWNAFCKMYIALARRAPRTVWEHFFASNHNGWLDFTMEFSLEQQQLISNGLCTNCEQQVGTQITRCTLRCVDCHKQQAKITRNRWWLNSNDIVQQVTECNIRNNQNINIDVDDFNDRYKSDDSLFDYC